MSFTEWFPGFYKETFALQVPSTQLKLNMYEILTKYTKTFIFLIKVYYSIGFIESAYCIWGWGFAN